MRKYIDGIYRKPKYFDSAYLFSEYQKAKATYNYWGKIPDKTNTSPRLQLPDYYYSDYTDNSTPRQIADIKQQKRKV